MKTIRSICAAIFVAVCIYTLCSVFNAEFDFRLWSVETRIACAIPMLIFGYVAYSIAGMLQNN
jgi:hypothetical protein